MSQNLESTAWHGGTGQLLLTHSPTCGADGLKAGAGFVSVIGATGKSTSKGGEGCAQSREPGPAAAQGHCPRSHTKSYLLSVMSYPEDQRRQQKDGRNDLRLTSHSASVALGVCPLRPNQEDHRLEAGWAAQHARVPKSNSWLTAAAAQGLNTRLT